MSKTIRILDMACVAALAVGVAVSPRAQAAGIADNKADPAPQRSRMAQAAQPAGQNAGGAASSLPGGASSLSETYKDWRVACVQDGAAKRCSLSQVQTRQDGQRVLAIELNAPSGNTASGVLVMPFGLALESGVTLQIDEKPAMAPMRFRTCMPGGCLVPVSFDAATLATLRNATALKVKAVADSGQATPFSISLQGFGTALDRVGALAR